MLAKEIKILLKGRKFITAINSESYIHYRTHRGIKIKRGSGGAQHLMDYIMKKTDGLMVAVGSGNADKEVIDTENKILLPPGKKSYTLKRIFLNKEEIDNYYNGFSNQTLWPLCHLAFVKPLFEKKWWLGYKKVNEKFADAIIDEIKDDEAFVWVNDYQLCLLPKLLKERNPNIKVGTFWHIPWPTKEIFSICPWSREIVEGLVASDFIGFHRDSYVQNFIKTALSELSIDIRPDENTLYINKHHTKLDSLPAGIDYEEISKEVNSVESDENPVKKDFDIEYEKLIIGVDRVDYTKGLVERIHILDSFFGKHPEYIGKLVHLLIGAPSREHITTFKSLSSDLLKAIDQINWKYSEGSWSPVCLVNESIDPQKIYQYYRAADVCFVSSLDDGMNLVAKEYPVCAEDGKGALLLSKYTGASQELTSAFQINPYNVAESVEKLYEALKAPANEKKKRMDEMRKVLKSNDIDYWTINFIKKTLS